MRINIQNTINNDLGEPTPGVTIGKVMAQVLGNTKSSDPLRSHVLGMKFLDKSAEYVELDASEEKFVRGVLESSDFKPFVVGQLLLKFDEKANSKAD